MHYETNHLLSLKQLLPVLKTFIYYYVLSQFLETIKGKILPSADVEDGDLLGQNSSL